MNTRVKAVNTAAFIAQRTLSAAPTFRWLTHRGVQTSRNLSDSAAQPGRESGTGSAVSGAQASRSNAERARRGASGESGVVQARRESRDVAHACEALARAQPSPFLPLVAPRRATQRRDPGAEGVKTVPKSFFRRPLDTGLVAFSSAEGRKVLRELLPAGGAEGVDGGGSFFEMMEAYDMQQHPVSCGVASLAIALTALRMAPWRPPAPGGGAFQHVTETEVLELIADTDIRQRVASSGITLEELGAIVAEVPGLQTQTVLCKEGAEGEVAFLDALGAATSGGLHQAGGAVMVLNFSRATLGQTGSGHFSPVGAWHKARDLVLLLDTARFKYPAFWGPTARIWRSVSTRDDQTARPRGYLLVSRTVGI